MDVLRRGLRPRQIVTRAALENAIAGVNATGGSTNAVLHLLAIAREAGVPLTIDDFDPISRRTPLWADLKPGGTLHRGRPRARRRHRRRRASAWSTPSWSTATPSRVTGRTFAEEAARARETPGQEVVLPLDRPLKPTGGLVILKGTLAPDGCVVKVAGHERTQHRGPARVFEREEDAMAAVLAGADPRRRRRRHPLRGPARRARACARCSASPRRIVGEGLGEQRGAPHRRPLQRRDARA